jgi:hypothetical protein
MEGKHAVVEALPCGVGGVCLPLIYCAVITKICVEDDNFVLDGILGWSYEPWALEFRIV